ncbi:MAG TPA: hypothetical protein VF192_00930 [Longimicrobiales bacterium]
MSDPITLKPEHRARIRNSSTKKGYVVELRFARRPRGGKVRPAFIFCGVVRQPAADEAASAQARYRDFVTSRRIHTVDHMGTVLATEEV